MLRPVLPRWPITMPRSTLPGFAMTFERRDHLIRFVIHLHQVAVVLTLGKRHCPGGRLLVPVSRQVRAVVVASQVERIARCKRKLLAARWEMDEFAKLCHLVAPSRQFIQAPVARDLLEIRSASGSFRERCGGRYWLLTPR